jgi:hypothetical protein
MPTLLEQLQMYEAQRARSLRQPPPPPPAAAASGSQQHIARVTSFERCEEASAWPLCCWIPLYACMQALPSQ